MADAETLYLTFRKVLDAADKRSSEEKEKSDILAAPSAGGMRRRGTKESSSIPVEIPIANQEGVAVVETTWEIDPLLRALLG